MGVVGFEFWVGRFERVGLRMWYVIVWTDEFGLVSLLLPLARFSFSSSFFFFLYGTDRSIGQGRALF